MFKNNHIIIAITLAILLLPSFAFGQWFEEVANPYGVDHSGYGESCSWADYDNDGDQDLLITNSYFSPYVILYQNNYPSPNFTDVTSLAFEEPFDHTCYCAVWGDYNNDGLIDVYFGLTNADPPPYEIANRLYHNDGS